MKQPTFRLRSRHTLLLHICCAPCATYVVQTLREHFEVIGVFYNPNIHPEEEVALRLREVRRYAAQIGLRVFVPEYEVDRWYEAVKGTEQEREGGKRCAICYRLRMEQTARFAQEHRVSHFATTLTVSPHKKAAVINPIGRELAEQYSVAFYEADFKKRDGFKISCRMSREAGLYRQSYCGCIFSKRERERERQQRSRGAEAQRRRGAEEQRSRGAEAQRSRGAEEFPVRHSALFYVSRFTFHAGSGMLCKLRSLR